MRKVSRALFLSILAIFSLMTIAQAQTQLVALLTTGAAGVELQRVGTASWIPINVESIVGSGDTVRTVNGGTATIHLPDDAITIALSADTIVRLDQLVETSGGYDIAYTVSQGSTAQTLTSPSGASANYTINAPNIRLVSPGAEFRLWAQANGATEVLNHDGALQTASAGGMIDIPAGHGIRAYPDGRLSGVIPARQIETLHAALDGVPAVFAFDGDMVLNVRQGPERETTAIGTIAPADIDLVMGISEDGEWYRIPFSGGFGWVLGRAIDVNMDETNLPAFPQAYLEANSNQMVAAAPTAIPSNGALAQYSAGELEVLAAINEWRIERDIWPLSLNDTLTEMAQGQADYLRSLPEIPDDLHMDAQGRNVRQRALDGDYNWPTYGRPDRMAVGEIAYVGFSARAAENFWEGSSLHFNTAVNSSYREVGIATVPHRLGNIYVVTFGSRPNVFPALVDPSSGTLYLSEETYRYASGGNWLTDIEEVQILPNAGAQPNDSRWSAWDHTLTLPTSGSFAVAYRDAENDTAIFPVNTAENIAWLPSNVSTAATNARQTVSAAPQPPAAAAAIQPTVAAPTRQPVMFPTNTPPGF